MKTSHDPYRDTAKRLLEEKKRKEKRKIYIENQKKIQENTLEKKSIFLKQEVEIPETINNLLGITIATFFPYIIGTIFIFFIIAKRDMETYLTDNLHTFLFAWIIGYEILTLFFLSFILKSAFSFSRHQLTNLN